MLKVNKSSHKSDKRSDHPLTQLEDLASWRLSHQDSSFNILKTTRTAVWLIVFCARCASCTLDVSCARFSRNEQYMCKICTRLYLFPHCAIYAQDCTSFSNAQYMRKFVIISPMRNICARFAQDCTSFPSAQYMRKICTRLYLISNLKC